MPDALDVFTYSLDYALDFGVPDYLAETARDCGGIDLTRDDGTAVRFRFDAWPPGSRGAWYAKRHTGGRTFTGYAGGHAPRGGGVPGLSPEGIARALAGLDRQEHRWASGEAKPRDRGPVCPSCGRLAPQT